MKGGKLNGRSLSQHHDTGLLSLMIDPLVQGLRHDARYNDVLMKIGLPVRL